MADLIIYGASDDCIEVEGLVRDELYPGYGRPSVVTVKVDDTMYAQIVAQYDPDGTGEWRIRETMRGALVTIVAARGEGADDDEHGCPGYSDKAVIDMSSIEARRIDVVI